MAKQYHCILISALALLTVGLTVTLSPLGVLSGPGGQGWVGTALADDDDSHDGDDSLDGDDSHDGDSEDYGDDGYDREGYDRHGQDRDGFDHEGYSREGHDRGGYDREGYRDDGHHRDGHYDEHHDHHGRRNRNQPTGSGGATPTYKPRPIVQQY